MPRPKNISYYLGCLLLAFGVLSGCKSCYKWSAAAVILGISLFLFIPTSVKISDIIETTYKDSVNSAITTADSTASSISASAETSDESEPNVSFDIWKSRLPVNLEK